MFGYATDESESYLPLAIDLAHRITKRLTDVRVNNIIKGIRPDGKAQVTVCYDEIGKPMFVDKIVVSAQHDEEIDLDKFKKEIIEKVIKEVVPSKWLVKDTKYFINPTGRFVIGGPHGDSGLTGRKIIIDTYGSFARHGGGAFSGKDPSKVDRSASYMARYIAKNIVASGIARVCEIQLAYIIGISKPASFYINCFNTNKVSLEEIRKTVLINFDLTPKGIIKTLDLLRPIYRETVNFGHFGRNNVNFLWENTDKIDIFTKLL